MRGVAQDLCRHDHFKKQAEDKVVVILDWAMKFLPLIYREKQSERFSQKGFNWHVTVCVFKDSGDDLKVFIIVNNNAISHKKYNQLISCTQKQQKVFTFK